MTPSISVIVPCHNRAKYLDVHLRSLSWSVTPVSRFEVVVVDDGSTDDVTRVVERWRKKGLDVQLIRIARAPGLRNNAVARNTGLRAARYPVVIQTDPDIVFASDVLAAARQAIAPGVFLSCSGYYPLTRESTLEVAFGRAGPSNDAGDYLEHARGRPNQVLSPDGVGGLHGAFVCWRDELRAAGGYDESFRFWGWEDRELIVTLVDRGLIRQTMSETDVVHLWHSPARGELFRETLASRGLISRTAWEVQMQRAAADYPRAKRPTRVGTGAGIGQEALDCRAFAEWPSMPVTSEEAIPVSWQLFFDAHRLEASSLFGIGRFSLARSLLIQALRRPWEASPSNEMDRKDTPSMGVAIPQAVGRYQRLVEVLELLAECHWRLQDLAAHTSTLKLLESLPEGTPAAAAIRATTALRQGDLAGAILEAADLKGSAWTPLRAALAIELALLDDRPEIAGMIAREAIWNAHTADFFEQIRLVEYVRLLVRLEQLRNSESAVRMLSSSPAALDTTEFVFSAAVRSQRAGLDVAAFLLCDRFLSDGGRSDHRLLLEAAGQRRAALARLQRSARPAVWESLAQKSYSRSNAAMVCFQS